MSATIGAAVSNMESHIKLGTIWCGDLTSPSKANQQTPVSSNTTSTGRTGDGVHSSLTDSNSSTVISNLAQHHLHMTPVDADDNDNEDESSNDFDETFPASNLGSN